MNCEDSGHLFLKTEPPCCVDCAVTLTRYDLIRTRGDGRVFIVGQLNEIEKKRFDKALRRKMFNRLNRIMVAAFARYGYDVSNEATQLHRPF